MRLCQCILGFSLAVCAIGCESPRTQISAAALAAQARQDPMDHLVYRGGDAQFYFIDRAQKTTHRYKVLRDELSIPDSYLNAVLPPAVLRKAATQPAEE